jgi:hypothetical protein
LTQRQGQAVFCRPLTYLGGCVRHGILPRGFLGMVWRRLPEKIDAAFEAAYHPTPVKTIDRAAESGLWTAPRCYYKLV